MTLSVSNTLTGEREAFEPIADDEVLLYACGLTTSDPAHLGHARMWVHTDVMHRWLEYRGYQVHHIENFTDVNEKIVARVGEDGDSEAEVAREHIASFLADMRALNLKRADVYPRVTEHIDHIIDMVDALIESGHAYESNGSVYFDVTSFEEYGKLSNQDLESMEAHGPAEEQAEKRNPADFALWKSNGVTPAEIEEHRHDEAAPAAEACDTALTWESPWGEGRPGWHIECSAMSTTHLGETFDIHVAGQDIVFPHNENEIAQAEAATGQTFARYWLHIGLLEISEEKMSSSLGNYLTVQNLLHEFGVDAIRTFLLSTSYGQRQTYSESTFHEAVERSDRLERAYERATAAADSVDAGTWTVDEGLRTAVEDTRADFGSSMDDDFNTRGGLRSLDDLATAVNRHLDHHKAYDYRGLKQAVDTFEELGSDVLGLSYGGEADGDVRLVDDLVELILEVRDEERDAGNYERADALRERLADTGVTVEDTDDGVEYRY